MREPTTLNLRRIGDFLAVYVTSWRLRGAAGKQQQLGSGVDLGRVIAKKRA
jgi:hypothetical protein